MLAYREERPDGELQGILRDSGQGGPRGTQCFRCGYVLCTVALLALVTALVTVLVLLTGHVSPPPPPAASLLPSPTPSPPPVTVLSGAGPEGRAVVTVDRGDGRTVRVSVLPACPAAGPQLGAMTEQLRLALAQRVAVRGTDSRASRAPAGRGERGAAGLPALLRALRGEQSKLLQLVLAVQQAQEELGSSLRRLSETVGNLVGAGTGTALPGPPGDLPPSPCCSSVPTAGLAPQHCSDVYASGGHEDGVYAIYTALDPAGVRVYCDMTTDGGGWTVIQRRQDGSVDFFRDWSAYRDGFGHVTGEHWLGLARVHGLTVSAPHELRAELEDFENATAFARYDAFGLAVDSVNAEDDGYPLSLGNYSGTAGDSLSQHRGMAFSTRDRDSDEAKGNCAAQYRGAWWYRNCHTSNLNGLYLHGAHMSYADGIEWSSWTGWQYSLKRAEMKIRPVAHAKSKQRP